MDNKVEVENLHDAFIKEKKQSFSQAIQRDRLYKRPAGYVEQNGIWIVAVLLKYFMKQVLHFSHVDFMKAMKEDLGPVQGEVGMWVLQNYIDFQKARGKDDNKKRAMIVMEIIKSFLEKQYEYIGKETKYNFINKYSPKKMPEKVILRSSIKIVYSWMHHAPNTWFEETQKQEEDIK